MWNDKSDEYPITARNPTGTGINFYPQVRVQISTHSLFADRRVITLPDPNLTRCLIIGGLQTQSFIAPTLMEPEIILARTVHVQSMRLLHMMKLLPVT
jgi:hypothetical protein